MNTVNLPAKPTYFGLPGATDYLGGLGANWGSPPAKPVEQLLSGKLDLRRSNAPYSNSWLMGTMTEAPPSPAKTETAQKQPTQPKPASDPFVQGMLGYINQVYTDQKSRQARMDSERQRAQAAANRNAARMGAVIDRGLAQNQANWASAQGFAKGMYNQMANDPGYSLARNWAIRDSGTNPYVMTAPMQQLQALAMQQAASPGLDPKLLETIKGNLSRRSAAMGGGAMRDIQTRAGAYGVRGPAMTNELTLERLGRGASLNSALANAELDWAMKNQSAKQDSMRTLAGVAGMAQDIVGQNVQSRERAKARLSDIMNAQYGQMGHLGNAYINALTGSNPLQWLGQAQGLTAPMQALPQSMMTQAVQPTGNEMLPLLMALAQRRSGQAME